MTRVKEGDFCEEKMANLEEIKRCTVLESADGSSFDGPGEYAVKMLIEKMHSVGIRPIEKLPMKSRKEKRIRTLRKS